MKEGGWMTTTGLGRCGGDVGAHTHCLVSSSIRGGHFRIKDGQRSGGSKMSKNLTVTLPSPTAISSSTCS